MLWPALWPPAVRRYPVGFWSFSGQLWPRRGRVAAVIRPLSDVIRPAFGRSPASFGRDEAGSQR
eukprot:9300446-Alexandrium_andersonii.AAC.1